MPDTPAADPLASILPRAKDRAAWICTHSTIASDTAAEVLHYEHQPSGRTLRLDGTGRVYGQDPQGVVRLFGRGGAMALAVALNVVFDGMDHLRPGEVVLPESATV
jgi:hypothetical protein